MKGTVRKDSKRLSTKAEKKQAKEFRKQRQNKRGSIFAMMEMT